MNPLTEFDSPRKFFNHADNGGKAINGYSLCVLGPGIVASIEPASPSPGEVVKLKLDAPYAAAVPGMQTQIADLLERVATLEASAAAFAPYAIAGGRWDMPDVVTGDTEAGHGQCVRVDMTGKAAPDVVTVTLPASTAGTKGQPVCVMTVSLGGAEDGSKLRIETTGGQLITSGLGTFIEGTSEIRFTVVDNGNGWDIQSSP